VVALQGGQESAWEWFQRGLRYDTDTSTYHLAIEAYGRAIAVYPEFAEAYVNQGNVWFNLGALAEAERSYRRAIGIHPHYAPAYFNLGNVLEEEDRNHEAASAYTKAIELDPGFSDAHFNLAGVLEKLDAHHEAQKEWRKYLALDPDSPWAEAARERLEAGRRAVEAERKEETAPEASREGDGTSRPTPHGAFDR
jgi:tetratricopeptide (TPR) repeat protein